MLIWSRYFSFSNILLSKGCEDFWFLSVLLLLEKIIINWNKCFKKCWHTLLESLHSLSSTQSIFRSRLFKWFDGFFVVVTLVYIFYVLALMNRFICSQNHSKRKMVSYICLKMAVLNWQCSMQFAIIWSIEVAEFFPPIVGLFIVGIMLYWYIKIFLSF